MRNIKDQRGMTFISWLVVAAIFIFIAVTVVKLVPLYIKYDTVKTIVDSVASDPKSKKLGKRAIMAKVNKNIDISSIYDLKIDKFTLKKVRTQKKARELAVSYEDRIPWFANLEIVAVFEYSAIIGNEK